MGGESHAQVIEDMRGCLLGGGGEKLRRGEVISNGVSGRWSLCYNKTYQFDSFCSLAFTSFGPDPVRLLVLFTAFNLRGSCLIVMSIPLKPVYIVYRAFHNRSNIHHLVSTLHLVSYILPPHPVHRASRCRTRTPSCTSYTPE